MRYGYFAEDSPLLCTAEERSRILPAARPGGRFEMLNRLLDTKKEPEDEEWQRQVRDYAWKDGNGRAAVLPGEKGGSTGWRD